MRRAHTRVESEDLDEILKDPVKSGELADRAIDAWIEEQGGIRSGRSSRSSKKNS